MTRVRELRPGPVAVVGGTGWIGRRTVIAVRARGHLPRVVSRRRPSEEGTDWHPLGEVPSLDDLVAGLDGCAAVVNVAGAAHLADDRADSAALFANGSLPGLIGEASVACGIDRIVHVSSIKAVAERGDSLSADSTTQPTTQYGSSKLEGELALRRAVLDSPAEVVVVRPPMVYGADAPANFERLRRFASSRMPVPPPHPYPRRSLIYIENLSSLLVYLAASAPSPPETVHVADLPHLTTRDLVRRLAAGFGGAGRVLPVPTTVATRVAAVAGRSDDVHRLADELVVKPSPGSAFAGWSPPFPDHEGFRDMARGVG
jgi:nucleoside-diphosphate-sugar epimerase